MQKTSTGFRSSRPPYGHGLSFTPGTDEVFHNRTTSFGLTTAVSVRRLVKRSGKREEMVRDVESLIAYMRWKRMQR